MVSDGPVIPKVNHGYKKPLEDSSKNIGKTMGAKSLESIIDSKSLGRTMGAKSLGKTIDSKSLGRTMDPKSLEKP